MQAIRLMGMPDKVIAFDELPEDLLAGLEMREPVGPQMRVWRDWLGKRKKTTKVAPERDPMTGHVRTFQPIVEEAPFFYIVDETMGPDQEKWEAICDYVKRTCPKDFRLKDRIEDMAIPFAPDVRADINIEPEQVVVIPLHEVKTEAPATLTAPNGQGFTKDQPATAAYTEKQIKEMSHDKSCETLGRGGRYSEKCQKCELLKANKELELAH